MLRIACRKSCGIPRSASATMASNFARSTAFPRLAFALTHQRVVVVAVVTNDALFAERLWFADAPPVQDQRVGRLGPVRLAECRGELLLDDFRLVALGDADPIGDAQHVPVDRQPWDAKRVAEDNVGGFTADAGQRDECVHAGWHLAAVIGDER